MQPELLALREVLLRFGGSGLVAPPDRDPDLEALLRRGQLMNGTVLESSMVGVPATRMLPHFGRDGSWTVSVQGIR